MAMILPTLPKNGSLADASRYGNTSCCVSSAARRDERVKRVAGCRGQHKIGCRQAADPIPIGCLTFEQIADCSLAAVQAADAAEQMRKALEVSGFLNDSAT